MQQCRLKSADSLRPPLWNLSGRGTAGVSKRSIFPLTYHLRSIQKMRARPRRLGVRSSLRVGGRPRALPGKRSSSSTHYVPWRGKVGENRTFNRPKEGERLEMATWRKRRCFTWPSPSKSVIVGCVASLAIAILLIVSMSPSHLCARLVSVPYALPCLLFGTVLHTEK